ncbi:hypothetical protein JCM10213_001410 [Rhodosporidiobolus nylandii]
MPATNAKQLAKGAACATCKARKVRCDAIKPACTACRRSARFRGEDPNSVCCSYFSGRRCGASAGGKGAGGRKATAERVKDSPAAVAKEKGAFRFTFSLSSPILRASSACMELAADLSSITAHVYPIAPLPAPTAVCHLFPSTSGASSSIPSASPVTPSAASVFPPAYSTPSYPLPAPTPTYPAAPPAFLAFDSPSTSSAFVDKLPSATHSFYPVAPSFVAPIPAADVFSAHQPPPARLDFDFSPASSYPSSPSSLSLSDVSTASSSSHIDSPFSLCDDLDYALLSAYGPQQPPTPPPLFLSSSQALPPTFALPPPIPPLQPEYTPHAHAFDAAFLPSAHADETLALPLFGAPPTVGW